MAVDNRSVVITLKLDSGKEQDAKPTDTEATKKNTDKDSTAKSVAKFAVIQSAQLVVNEVVAWAEYYWNRELILNDDYVGQRNKNIAMMQINRAVGVVTTTGSMAAAGAAIGGPAGAIVGAVIGLATSASSIARSNIQGQDQQNIAIRQMDAQLHFTRSKAGWSTQAASIGEDL